jgi:hypothetical protein
MLPSYLLIKHVHAVIILKFVLHVPPIFLGFITSITFMAEYEIRSSAISFPFSLSSFACLAHVYLISACLAHVYLISACLAHVYLISACLAHVYLISVCSQHQ